MTWTQRWYVLFGTTPTESERDSLLDWLDKHCEQWTPTELHDALEAYSVGLTSDQRRMRRPTGPELRTLIMDARRAASSAQWCDCYRLGKSWRERIDVIQRRLREATPEQRWNILCEVYEAEARNPLYEFAKRLPGGVVAFRPQGGIFGVAST